MGIASERPLTNLVCMGMGRAVTVTTSGRRGLWPAGGAARARGAGGVRYAALLIAAACAQPGPIPPPASRDWPLAKTFEAYLAADERLALRIDAPAGALRVNCGITGEGAYARVEVRRGGEIVARGTCGDNIDARDLPAGPVTVVVLVLSAPGQFHLVADAIGPEALSVQGGPPEQGLFAALQRRDARALDALLMDDFSSSRRAGPRPRRLRRRHADGRPARRSGSARDRYLDPRGRPLEAARSPAGASRTLTAAAGRACRRTQRTRPSRGQRLSVPSARSP